MFICFKKRRVCFQKKQKKKTKRLFICFKKRRVCFKNKQGCLFQEPLFFSSAALLRFFQRIKSFCFFVSGKRKEKKRKEKKRKEKKRKEKKKNAKQESKLLFICFKKGLFQEQEENKAEEFKEMGLSFLVLLFCCSKKRNGAVLLLVSRIQRNGVLLFKDTFCLRN